MTANPEPHTDRTRPRLLTAACILLVLSLLLGIAGPRLTSSNLPADIGNGLGYFDWSGLGWIIVAMIVGALALMCFVAQWVLRPRRTNNTQPPGNTTSM